MKINKKILVLLILLSVLAYQIISVENLEQVLYSFSTGPGSEADMYYDEIKSGKMKAVMIKWTNAREFTFKLPGNVRIERLNFVGDPDGGFEARSDLVWIICNEYNCYGWTDELKAGSEWWYDKCREYKTYCRYTTSCAAKGDDSPTERGYGWEYLMKNGIFFWRPSCDEMYLWDREVMKPNSEEDTLALPATETYTIKTKVWRWKYGGDFEPKYIIAFYWVDPEKSYKAKCPVKAWSYREDGYLNTGWEKTVECCPPDDPLYEEYPCPEGYECVDYKCQKIITTTTTTVPPTTTTTIPPTPKEDYGWLILGLIIIVLFIYILIKLVK